MHERMYNFKTVCIYNFLNAGYLYKPNKKLDTYKNIHMHTSCLEKEEGTSSRGWAHRWHWQNNGIKYFNQTALFLSVTRWKEFK
jgi:hypothetical protein